MPLVAGACLAQSQIAPALARESAYVANLLSGTVAVIDTATQTTTTTIPVGLDPDGIAVTPGGRFVYVANFRSDSVSVIDTGSNAVTATIAVGDGPVGIAIAPNGAAAYVVNKNAGTVSVVDTHSHTVTATVTIGATNGPNAVAVTPDGAQIYVTNSRLTDGTVSVIDTATKQITATIPVGNAPGRIAIAPQGGFAYVTNFRSGNVSVIDTSTNTVLTTIPVGTTPSAVSFTPDGSRAYVAGSSVSVIDTHSHVAIATIALGSSFAAVAITMTARFAYVTSFDASAVAVIDTRTNAVVQHVCVVSGPFAIALATTMDNPAGPFPKIVTPVSGFKLRPGRTVPVTVRVRAGTTPLFHWVLRLLGPGGENQQIAEGTTPVSNAAVAEISANELERGARYSLALYAEDSAGHLVTDTADFRVSDPQYALIPLEPGNFSNPSVPSVSVDGAGEHVAFAGGYDVSAQKTDAFVLDTTSGELQKLQLPIHILNDLRLSADAQRVVFDAGFLDFYTLADGTLTQGPSVAGRPFNIDRTGMHVAFEHFVFDPDNPDVPTLQYFYYDAVTGESRQLTNDPHAINPRGDESNATPLISGDGKKIVFASRATLGVAQPDPTILWRIFSYDVPSAVLHQVVSFPKENSFDLPVMSTDGRWLTFITSVPQLPDILIGARLDLETTVTEIPIGGFTDFSTSDAVVSGDGSAIVVSTRADVDSHVGNADHNQELFAYDVRTGELTQISETIGAPNGEAPYRPAVNNDANVVAFGTVARADLACPAAGSQRSEVDGFFLGRVRAVRLRAGNHAPVLRLPTFEQPGLTRVVAGQTLTLTFTATDADHDPVVFFAQIVGGSDVPSGSQIDDHHHGTATFRWPTTAANEGVYPVQVAAFDEGGGEAVQQFSIAVCSRMVSDDGDLPGVLAALFESAPPAPCHAADLNRDIMISAADAVAAIHAGA